MSIKEESKKNQNQIELSEIDSLYELFGFVMQKDFDGIRVYEHLHGYFRNIEIFALSLNDHRIEALKNDYEKAGYSVTIVSRNSVDDAHEKLYSGFFNIESTYKKMLSEYNRFCDNQTKRILQDDNKNIYYEYIPSGYYKNGKYEHEMMLVESIYNELLVDKAKFIILEAAAGLGKTCTIYELLHLIIKKHKELTIPMIIELTKSRSAKIFRYALHDEIESSFPGLSLELVISEIKRGNIILIIDGFDELLTSQADVDSFELIDTQKTMLDTISELFDIDSKAKIVLTSRKSSIITGELFESWSEKNLLEVGISRFQIGTPTIQDWIGDVKYKLIEKTVDIRSIANPVLLAYLRYLPEESFSNITNGEDIINIYFKRLLERERVRQTLELTVNEQIELLTDLAANFVSLEISSEDRDFLLDIVLDILGNKIDTYLARYINPEEAPSDGKEFSMKIVRHALLDRVSNTSNKIGFINDFIFGYFIANSVIMNKLNINDMLNEKYILDSTDAFATMSEEKRETFYSKIKQIVDILSPTQKLEIHRNLLRKNNDNFENVTFHNFVFNNMEIEKYEFKNCIFTACTFDHSNIDSNIFKDCMFIDCKFFECVFVEPRDDNNLIFTRCKGNEKMLFENSHDNVLNFETQDYSRRTLELIWPIGRVWAKQRIHEANLFKNVSFEDRKKYIRAIESLITDGLIVNNEGFLSLVYEKMNEIKFILGR